MDAIVDKVIFFALGYNSMCDICFQNNGLIYVKIKFKYIYFYTHIIPLSNYIAVSSSKHNKVFQQTNRKTRQIVHKV